MESPYPQPASGLASDPTPISSRCRARGCPLTPRARAGRVSSGPISSCHWLKSRPQLQAGGAGGPISFGAALHNSQAIMGTHLPVLCMASESHTPGVYLWGARMQSLIPLFKTNSLAEAAAFLSRQQRGRELTSWLNIIYLIPAHLSTLQRCEQLPLFIGLDFLLFNLAFLLQCCCHSALPGPVSLLLHSPADCF